MKNDFKPGMVELTYITPQIGRLGQVDSSASLDRQSSLAGKFQAIKATEKHFLDVISMQSDMLAPGSCYCTWVKQSVSWM